MLQLNTTPAAKPILNLAELAEVLEAAPEIVRHRTPLPVLSSYLYGLAFRKPNLIEEVEAVLEHETGRRARPTMAIVP